MIKLADYVAKRIEDLPAALEAWQRSRIGEPVRIDPRDGFPELAEYERVRREVMTLLLEHGHELAPGGRMRVRWLDGMWFVSETVYDPSGSPAGDRESDVFLARTRGGWGS